MAVEGTAAAVRRSPTFEDSGDDAKIDQTTESVDTLRLTFERYGERAQSLRGRIEELTNRVSELSRENDVLTARVTRAEREVAGLTATLTDETRRADAATGRADALGRELLTAQEETAAARDEASGDRTALAFHLTEIANLGAQLSANMKAKIEAATILGRQLDAAMRGATHP